MTTVAARSVQDLPPVVEDVGQWAFKHGRDCCVFVSGIPQDIDEGQMTKILSKVPGLVQFRLLRNSAQQERTNKQI